MADNVEILLIEDNPYDAEVTMRALKLKLPQHNYVHLTDGREALDFMLARGNYAFRQGNYPSMVLLDLDLPHVRGLEILKQIKSHPDAKKVPVVILTVSAQEPDIDEAYLLGANSYIVKPVDFPKFTEAMKQIGNYWIVLNQKPSKKD